MSGSFYVKIEFLAGTSIHDAAAEALAFAERVDANIEFQFNEVRCHISPGDDPKKLVDSFHVALEQDRFKLAFAR